MRWDRALTGLALLALAAGTLAEPGAKELPRWAPTLEQGLAQAKERGVVLMVVLNMDNERGNQGMVDEVYPSPEFHKAAARCVVSIASLGTHKTRRDDATGHKVCSRFGSVTCVDCSSTAARGVGDDPL